MITVTQYVKQNLKAHIQSDSPLPYRLTLEGISQYYGVSLMPVRQAVNDLVAEAVIQRKENGRLDIKNKPLIAAQRQATQAVDISSSKRVLTKAIMSDVITRSVLQNTEYLREEATAKRYGIGRTMVRQIFTRLSGEGMIEHVPRCGWRVRPYREEDMLAYLDIREILELEALRLAMPNMNKCDLQRLLGLNQLNVNAEVPRLDNDLHAYWVNRCGNRYIIEFFSRNGKYYSQLFNHAVLDRRMMEKMAAEHSAIIQCLLDDDKSGAEGCLIQHIREQRENIAQMVERLSDKSCNGG